MGGEKTRWSQRKGGKNGAGGAYAQCTVSLGMPVNLLQCRQLWEQQTPRSPALSPCIHLRPMKMDEKLGCFSPLAFNECASALKRLLSCRRTLAPFYSSFCLPSPCSASNVQSPVYLGDQDPEHALPLRFRVLVKLFPSHNLDSLTRGDTSSRGGCILPLISCCKHLSPLNCDFFS